MTGFAGGVSALCTLALLESGEQASSPRLQAAIEHLRKLPAPDRTYTVALETMALARARGAADRATLERNARWLVDNQNRGERVDGAWGYGVARGVADNSNSRFALLGLEAAQQAGAQVDKQAWVRAFDYWARNQNEDGSWGYTPGLFGTGSMTCSAIASIVVAGEHAPPDPERAERRRDAVARGVGWLAKHYSVDKNPNAAELELPWLLYYLTSLEDAGRLAKAPRIGDHDWFDEGSRRLVALQDAGTGSWHGHGEQATENALVSTSLALLFLTGKSQPQPPPPELEK